MKGEGKCNPALCNTNRFVFIATLYPGLEFMERKITVQEMIYLKSI